MTPCPYHTLNTKNNSITKTYTNPQPPCLGEALTEEICLVEEAHEDMEVEPYIVATETETNMYMDELRHTKGDSKVNMENDLCEDKVLD